MENMDISNKMEPSFPKDSDKKKTKKNSKQEKTNAVSSEKLKTLRKSGKFNLSELKITKKTEEDPAIKLLTKKILGKDLKINLSQLPADEGVSEPNLQRRTKKTDQSLKLLQDLKTGLLAKLIQENCAHRNTEAFGSKFNEMYGNNTALLSFVVKSILGKEIEDKNVYEKGMTILEAAAFSQVMDCSTSEKAKEKVFELASLINNHKLLKNDDKFTPQTVELVKLICEKSQNNFFSKLSSIVLKGSLGEEDKELKEAFKTAGQKLKMYGDKLVDELKNNFNGTLKSVLDHAVQYAKKNNESVPESLIKAHILLTSSLLPEKLADTQFKAPAPKNK